MERKTYSNLETGRTKTIKPQVAEAVSKVLPVTVLQIVQALGYPIAFGGIETEEEVEILEAYRSASAGQHLAVRGALQLPVRQPLDELGRLLSRQEEMDRQGRQGNLE